MKIFYQLLGVALIGVTTNNFVWFALTYWIYLSTRSVISTSVLAGLMVGVMALAANWLGSVVDHHRKKHVLLGSVIVTLIFFVIGWLVFRVIPETAFSTVSSLWLWILVILLSIGVVAGNIYNIAIPTLVAFLVPAQEQGRANGLFSTIMGISFAITSVASGFALAFGGFSLVLKLSILFTLLALVTLGFISIPEENDHSEPSDDTVGENIASHRKMDIKGTIKIIKSTPGLFSLIFFTTFNNFLGGVFMALMDAYGLSLVSVKVWGVLWGFLSLGFILGGLYISKKGLGTKPLRNLFRINLVVWVVCIFFTIQPSIVLLAVGTFIWIFFVPFIEATEQTILQKVIPKERLGRVFGFAQSIEQAASPLTTFFIGPITQFFFIPFMTSGPGVQWIGDWFGVGPGRGIALVFITAGTIGFLVTLIAMRSYSYKLLAAKYEKEQKNN